MKRILLACFLLTATCSVTFVQQAVAHAPAAAVTLAAFTAKVNLMDSQIGSGDITSAQATWTELNTMMINAMANTKHSVASAPTAADKDALMVVMNSQYSIYNEMVPLKQDLATNRVALHTKLVAFGATII